jgi:hypothetical protein
MDSEKRAATEMARGEGWSFWSIGTEVFRSATGSGLDTTGAPLGKRWECSLDQWLRYRTVFAWAKDC